MSSSEIDLTQTSINKSVMDFSNKFNVNVSSLTVFPPMNDCFIQISPNNNYIAFVQNYSLEIFTKENGSWNRTLQHRISFDKKKIKGINWSLDSKMILIYGNSEDNKSLIKVINLNNLSWTCEIGFKGNINHASFYPDSLNIVYIKSPINILNIFSLLKYNNINSKHYKSSKDKIKYEYLFLKFDDERSINYIENNNNTFMILPIFGRRLSDKNNKFQNIEPSDYIIILVNKKVFKFFAAKTVDLYRIVPLNNRYSFFIVIDKDFYNLPFFIYNLYGEIMFKSEFSKQTIPRRLTNPCLLYNKNKKTNFIVVQAPEGRLEIFGCQNILSRSDICYFYDYSKLTDFIEKNKKSKSIINFGSKNQNSLNISQENINVLENENYVEMDDILFLEEQVININENDNNTKNGVSNEEINSKKNKSKRKLIKVKPFDVDPCYDENDYLMHSEISPNKNYICFINKKYPKYLYFASYFQSGVFKIIKFMNEVISFKWSTEEDILLVTLDSPFLYLITKDYYLNYNLEENYNFNNIMWSPLGKEVILSSEEKKVSMVAILN
jgi:hypothetical protein